MLGYHLLPFTDTNSVICKIIVGRKPPLRKGGLFWAAHPLSSARLIIPPDGQENNEVKAEQDYLLRFCHSGIVFALAYYKFFFCCSFRAFSLL